MRPRPAPQGIADERLTIEKLVSQGYGLARAQGRVWMVPYTAPGDVVTVRAVEDRGGWVLGAVVDLEHGGAARREAAGICPHAVACGGCSWPHLALSAQAELKAVLVRETLMRLGGIDLPGAALRVRPSPLAYRLRTQLKIERRGERLAVGFYRQRSRQIEAIESCQLVTATALERARRFVAALEPVAVSPVELHLLEDLAGTRQVAELVLPVAGRGGLRSAAREAGTIAAAAADAGYASLTIAGPQGEGRRVLFGDAAVEMDLGRLRLRAGMGSFFQVNRFVLPVLLADLEAICGAAGLGGERRAAYLADLYGGVGLFAFWLAPYFERVVSVEAGGPSATDARRNRAALGIASVELVAETVERWIGGASLPAGGWVLVDPPRAGLAATVRTWLAAQPAGRILYLSCDVGTLARDLRELVAAGWRLAGATLYDMFPNTHHAEILVTLERHGA